MSVTSEVVTVTSKTAPVTVLTDFDYITNNVVTLSDNLLIKL